MSGPGVSEADVVRAEAAARAAGHAGRIAPLVGLRDAIQAALDAGLARETGEMLAFCLDGLGAGGAGPVGPGEDLTEEAARFAAWAEPRELEVYFRAIVPRLAECRLGEGARKRMMIGLWNSLPPEDRAAFLERVGR